MKNQKTISTAKVYKYQSLSVKTQNFLSEVYHELVVKGNSKLAIRKLLISHNMSDSSRKALFTMGVIANDGDRNGRKYKWTGGILNQNLFDEYLKEIRKINKTQKNKQNTALIKNYLDKKQAEKKSNRFATLGLLLVASTLLFRTFKRFR